MLLLGQYDSPFVRRVGITLQHYGLSFEHRPYSVFRDAERIAEHNPLRKVPTLVLDDGTAFADSMVILDLLDARLAAEYGGHDPRLLLPRNGPSRVAGLRVCGFLTGALEKAVSLVYERELRSQADAAWQARCRAQLLETLAMLEAERAAQSTPYWLGGGPSHADVFVACALTFVRDALPELLSADALPALHALGRRCAQMPAFEGIYQPFAVQRS